MQCVDSRFLFATFLFLRLHTNDKQTCVREGRNKGPLQKKDLYKRIKIHRFVFMLQLHIKYNVTYFNNALADLTSKSLFSCNG